MVEGEETTDKVLWGKQYIYKLKYKEDKGFSARSYYGPTGFDKTPTAGGKSGGKTVGMLPMYSLMAHGAKANLRDIAIYKSQDNPEFWRSYITGSQLPTPSPTFSYHMFMDYLKGAGIKPKKSGDQIKLVPLTDRDILGQSKGEVTEAKVVIAKTLLPEKNGLFDIKITGGTDGENWSHIALTRKIPNPVFEPAIKNILDITQTQYDDLVAGRTEVDGKKFGDAMQAMLSKISPEEELANLKKEAATAEGSALNKLNKKMRFLKNMIDGKLTARSFFLHNVPVVPPKIRPVYPDDTGNLINSPLNDLYKDLILLNNASKSKFVPQREQENIAKDIYDQTKRLMGYATASDKARLNPKKANQKGLVELIAGDSPKEGYFQKKMVKKRQNLTGAGVVSIDTKMDIDEIGIPEEMAYKMFEPMIKRKMLSAGMTPFEAMAEVDNKTPVAARILGKVMDEKHVIVNRAPTLHKYGVMAFKPKLVQGKSIRVPLMVVKGFNMDFDGDKVLVHTPVTAKAEAEAHLMLPSNNVIHPTKGEVMNMPSWDDLTGLYAMTKDGKSTDKKYKTTTDALEAYLAGDISENDMIKVKRKMTNIGRIMVNNALPDGVDINEAVTDGSLSAAVKSVVKNTPDQIGKVLKDVKLIGDTYATRRGMSLNYDDLAPIKEVDDLIKTVTGVENAAEIQGKIQDVIKDRMKDTYYDYVDASGAKGQWAPVTQIIGSPIMFQGPGGSVPPIISKDSYASGLSPSAFWGMGYAARMGGVSKAKSVVEPGAFSKEILAASSGITITTEDCKTSEGKMFPVSSPEVLNRFAVRNIRVGGKVIHPKDQHLDANAIKNLKNHGIREVYARSPLKCKAIKGICRRCHGYLANGILPGKGDNVGTLAAQTLGEPLVQMAMRVFHTGSTVGSSVGAIGSLDRIRQITQLPKKIKDRAILAPKDGFVTDINESSIGGWDVNIGTKKLYVPAAVGLKVKRGT